MAALDHLNGAGVHIRAEGGRLHASGPLTDELRRFIRDHRDELVESLLDPRASGTTGTSGTVDFTNECPTALRLGSLVICATCQHHHPRPGAQPDGFCSYYDEPVWSRVPFACPAHESMESQP